MIAYRIYSVDVDGHFTSPGIEVRLEDDADAISFARTLDYLRVEIWAGTRLVECLDTTTKKLHHARTLPERDLAIRT